MKQILSLITLLAVAAISTATAADANRQKLNAIVTEANQILKQRQADPKQAIPPQLLKNAKAILIAKQWNVGLVLGGGGGTALVLRNTNDGWSAPAFYDIVVGSLGVQVGGQTQHTIALFMSEESLKLFDKNTIEWGAGGTAIFGPYGGNADISTVSNASILVYQATEGLQIGASFKGGKITYNQQAADLYFSTPDVTASQIYNREINLVPGTALNLIKTLDEIAK